MKTEERSIVSIIEEHLSSEELKLPVFSPTATRIHQEVAKEEPDLRVVEQLIASDQGLSSQLLRTSNSAFFQGLERVTTVHDAVIRLGVREVFNIVMLVTQKAQYQFEDPGFAEIARSLWKHSLACGLGSRWLAKNAGYNSRAQEAFLAGLLHDIGKLFLLTVTEDIRRDPKVVFNPSRTLVEELLASMHAEQGERLMKAWNLPELYSEIAREHHAQTFDTSNSLLTIVRLVNQACHKLGFGLVEDPSIVLAAYPEAQALSVSEIMLAELEIAIEDDLGAIAV